MHLGRALEVKKAVYVVLGFLTAATMVGFLWGRLHSVDSSKPTTAEIYLATEGRWRSTSSGIGRIELRAGNREYSYSTGDSQIAIEYLSPLQIEKEPYPHPDFDTDLEKFLSLAVAPPAGAGIVGGLFSSTGFGEVSQEASNSAKAGRFAAVAFISLGTAYLGYRLGHRSQIDYDDPVFTKTLEDVGLWRKYESVWRQVYYQAVTDRKLEVISPVPDESGNSCVQLDNDCLKSYSRQYEQKNVAELYPIFKVHPEIAIQAGFGDLVVNQGPPK